MNSEGCDSGNNDAVPEPQQHSSDGDIICNSISKPKLPKNSMYAQHKYWEERFKTEEGFEWLCCYDDVAEQLAPYLQKSDGNKNRRILVLGCGNSPFSEDLYNAGYRNIVNIDYSSNVIHRMEEKNQDKTSMEWMES